MPLVSSKAISNYFHISSIIQILHNSIEDVYCVRQNCGVVEFVQHIRIVGALYSYPVFTSLSCLLLALLWAAVHFTLIISRTQHTVCSSVANMEIRGEIKLAESFDARKFK